MFEHAPLATEADRPPGAADLVSDPRVAADLSAFDERRAGADELIDALQASARLISWAQARQVELIAEVVRREPPIQAPAGLSPVEPAVLEVGVALNWSAATARTRAHEAVDLVTDRIATLAALRDGRIDWPRMRAILEALAPLKRTPRHWSSRKHCSALPSRRPRSCAPSSAARWPATMPAAPMNGIDPLSKIGALSSLHCPTA